MIAINGFSYAQKTITPNQSKPNSKNTTLEQKVKPKEIKFHPSIKMDLNCDGILDSIIISTDNKPFFYIKTMKGYKLLDTKTMCLEDGTPLDTKSYYNSTYRKK
jgi:hypothetical protein